jgi:hypothetical protein
MQLTNYYDHPDHQLYMVFQFYVELHANAFEDMLIEEGITYERHLDVEGPRPRHLFGIHKRFESRAMHCNNMIHARYREKFIPNAWARWIMLIVTFGAVALAMTGYFLRKL